MTRALVSIVANKGGDSGEYNVKAYGAIGDGITDDRDAINTAATAAATDGGYLYFPQGTYKISSNITIACHCFFAKKAILSIDNTVVVTMTGNIEAQAFQIFDGDGTVSFLGNYVETHVYPQWWGVIGDNSTDNTDAINACFTAAGTGGIKVIFPKGTYKFLTTITAPYNIDIDMQQAYMLFMAADGANIPAIVIGDDTGTNYARKRQYIGLNVYRNTISSWGDDDDIGIQCINFLECDVWVQRSSYFNTGLQCLATPASTATRLWAGNNVRIGDITGCAKHVELTNTADDSGYTAYVNSNTFLGGYFHGSGNAAHNTKDRYGIYIKPLASATAQAFDHNVFIGTVIEMQNSYTSGDAVAVYVGANCNTNVFKDIRDETNDYALVCEDTAYCNEMNVTYGSGALSDTSTYAGSNTVKTVRYGYKYNKSLIYASGNLAEKSIGGQATNVALPAPIYYALYTSGTRYSGSTNLNITNEGIAYRAGTLTGIGIRVDTTYQKKFMLAFECNGAIRVHIVGYDSNGIAIDADSDVFLNVLDPSISTAKAAYFQTAGKCYYFADKPSPLYWQINDNVKSLDIIPSLQTGDAIKSFTLWGLDQTVVCPVLDAYEPIGGVEGCIGTASPTKYWKAYKKGKKIYNSDPDTGEYIGWVCVFSLTTALNGGEPLGETAMLVDDSTGVLTSDIVGVEQDDGTIHWTTVAGVPDGTHITLTNALTVAAGDDNAVYVNRWLGFGAIA